ncbi:ATP-binding cassette domain-containing protein [Vibrio sp. JC009]|uniref:ATP-binding cassette domain-containing protein n=1 Tax=Vibrio sp. JC009 TaxID=2912314 RepID=UPI0023B13D5A|nr:ATP-binding cassette domain-containing protein [Vibrio sp. JC009]WED21701.1 ATP-binding cassette domain-containing protein [Vibrio sp. JC009]
MGDFIQIKQLAKLYQKSGIFGKTLPKQVLTDINLTIRSGESLALVGASGSGKSTLCRLLLGLEAPSGGDICWNGVAFSDFTEEQWRAFRQDVQLVFQDAVSAVNPRQYVYQVLSEPLIYLRRIAKQDLMAECESLMAKVDLAPEILHRRAGQLSGGQLQRVGIARALATEPKLMVLDEPLSSLDLILQQQIIELLKSIQQRSGTAFLLVTHDLRLVEIFCQRVIVLDKGKIVESRNTGNDKPWESEMGRMLCNAVLPAMP